MTDDFKRIDEDQRIIISIKEGNRQSFGELYDKYAPALMGIILRITDNGKLAEEILKNAFVKAWYQIATYDASRISLFSWLIYLTRQTAFEEVKTQQAKNQPTKIPVNEETGIKNNSSIGNRHPQSTFDLIYYKGLSCAEAAAILNISVGELKAELRMTIKNMQSKKVYVEQ